MNPVVVQGLHKRFGKAAALDNVTFSLRENAIYGLLGRNGAGKTTLMQILAGHLLPSAGTAEVFGAAPYENDDVLTRVCFIKENLRYPDGFTVRQALSVAARLFPNWDDQFAQSLVDSFQLPNRRAVKKLSRGMTSAVSAIIGLAARAPLTFFDEPYLGLDAVARRMFYDRLLADYLEFPRTVVLSTHLIDEVSDLVEYVLLLDRGRLVVDDDADALRGQLVTVSGPMAAVDQVAADRPELHRVRLGAIVRSTVRGPFGDADLARADSLGVDVEPVSLQELVVRLTSPGTSSEPAAAGKELSR